jgi:hypothetical protein
MKGFKRCSNSLRASSTNLMRDQIEICREIYVDLSTCPNEFESQKFIDRPKIFSLADNGG